MSGKTKYPVLIKDGRCRVFWHRFRLSMWNIHRVDKNQYEGVVCEKNLDMIQRFCREKGLKFYINNSYGIRGTNYRADFFKANPPSLFGFYFCSYCGRPLRRKNITVDHLYPIGKAGRDLNMQKKLRRLGITNINDVRNLVPACYACNQKKGTQTGSWIWKGQIGRHPGFWVFRWFLRILFTIALIGASIYLYHNFIQI